MITLAKDGMRPDIERIWRLCFPEDSPEAVRYFFEHRYNPNACIVYVDNLSGRPVAMVHVLDIYITDDNEIKPAQYLYAAATRPDFQGRGIMTKLLAAAQRYAESKNKVYSVILPASHSLMKFYEKNGFYRCFKHRSMTFSRSDFETLSEFDSEKSNVKTITLGDKELALFRRDSLIDREGYATWDTKAVSYAMGVHESEGGRIIAVRKSHTNAYAFCRDNNGCVEVTEFICSFDMTQMLCRAILEAYPDGHEFSFRVPVANEFFTKYGDVYDFGMIKSTSGRKPTNLLTLTGRHTPYLGLALD